ncbi:MAG: hypothetical protein CL842_04610 [Crocinitomicaceae bacterium]|nr:hypothetical protein [Crocinitomicaceae bacterium]|tara:strand:- start:573 stop:989 length:417 start_codon:yes stop_codon:yes gene_type:complete
MKISKKSIKSFSAKVTIGLELGYTRELIEKTKIIKHIQKIQNELIENKDIFLSVSISECNIVMSGQIEPHLVLSFINYPKFPLEIQFLKNEIEELTRALMNEFEQNRTIIEYFDETVMLEKEKQIDPRIKNNYCQQRI